MPGQIRSDKKAMKIAYEILKTPEELQQGKKNKLTDKTINEWRNELMKTEE